MRGLLIRWMIQTLAILAAAYLLKGIDVAGFVPALLAAAILGILNAFLRPILLLVTLPINILSLGFFTFVINAFLLKLVSLVIEGFKVEGFFAALVGALFISVTSWILNALINDQGRVDVVNMRRGRNGRWE